MQRSKLFELKLYGMKAAFDEIMASPSNARRAPAHHRRSGEISEKQARPIN